MARNTICAIGEGKGFSSFISCALLSGYQILRSRTVSRHLPLPTDGDAALIVLSNIDPCEHLDRLCRSAAKSSPPIPVLAASDILFDDAIIRAILPETDRIGQRHSDVEVMREVVENLDRESRIVEVGGGNLMVHRINGSCLLRWQTLQWTQTAHPAIQKAIEFVKEYYWKPLSLEEIAQAACLSPYHFCRLFKRNVGISCMKYLTRLRIRKSRDLLRQTSKTVTEVCYSVGFNDLSHFERVFKAAVGSTPSTFRKGTRPFACADSESIVPPDCHPIQYNSPPAF